MTSNGIPELNIRATTCILTRRDPLVHVMPCPDAIRDADQIIFIRDGEIVEQGTHQRLLDRRGLLHHLYVSQFKGRWT